MKLSYQQFERICVLTISGDYTEDDVDQFRRTTTERLDAGSQHMLVDCEHLEFIDSAGLESLLRLRERLGEHGGQLRLINPEDNVRKILELTRLEKTFEAHATLEGAVRSVR